MNREKVIEELVYLPTTVYEGFYQLRITHDLRDKVVKLLKEQEAVVPTLIREGRNKYCNNYVCPRCDEEVVYEQNYCSECGVKFMWEGR